MIRMRTIADTARFFREQDPDTQLTEYTLRRLVASGQITTIKVGCKNLINLDTLIATLAQAGIFSLNAG